MKNLQPSIHVNRLKNAYRQGNSEGLEFYIIQALKRARAIESSPRERTEIALESARIYRMIGENDKSIMLCDNALANIPSGAGDLIGELNRLRVQLYLDSGEYHQAERLLEQIDGLEMTLHGNLTHISRKEENVKIETWLLAVETAVAQGKAGEAKEFFNKAVDKLTCEENDFHKRKQMAINEKRFLQTYFADMRDLITLFGAVLQIQFGKSFDDEFEQIRDLANRLRSGASSEGSEGAAAAAAAVVNVSNAPLLAKCLVMLNQWQIEAEKPPAGINIQEARRWFHFTKPIRMVETTGESLALAEHIPQPEAPALRLATETPLTKSSSSSLSIFDSQALTEIADTLRNLHNLAASLTENTRTQELFKDKIAFAGHLLCIDIGATLRNVSDSNFTGFIKFVWKPANYEGEVALGNISHDVEYGTAYLFCVDGIVIDATLGDMKPSESGEVAERIFDFLLQLGWSIGLSNNAPPDMKFDSIAEPIVRDRPRVMNFDPNGLVNRVTKITNRIYGLPDEDDEEEFNMDGFESAFMPAAAATTGAEEVTTVEETAPAADPAEPAAGTRQPVTNTITTELMDQTLDPPPSLPPPPPPIPVKDDEEENLLDL